MRWWGKTPPYKIAGNFVSLASRQQMSKDAAETAAVHSEFLIKKEPRDNFPSALLLFL